MAYSTLKCIDMFDIYQMAPDYDTCLCKACITLPIWFLQSGDPIDRRQTVSMTVLTVSTVRVFCS